jgi:PPK2 family polyphosphate:nucleotide phosphotransferase
VKLPSQLIEELTVTPGKAADLTGRSTSQTSVDWRGKTGIAGPHDVAEHDLETFTKELSAAQELLYASDAWAILVIIQALDAAGKDGTIKHVMSGVNPQGCEVVSFKQPSAEELSHDFLWRCAKVLPERGRIGIFNRSYYEEVLVTRIHPELLVPQHLPGRAKKGAKFWAHRYEDINAFEQHLERSGTRVIKVFLHLSKEEQKRRFLERLEDPSKHWKFSSADLAERAFFDQYQHVYEEVLSATSTTSAPWYVVPADHKHAARAIVGGILTRAIDQLDLHLPEMSAEESAALNAAREQLLEEGA